MGNNGDLNAMNAVLICTAVLMSILWITWAVRLTVCRHRLKNRNRALLRRLMSLNELKRKCSAYEDLLDNYRDVAEDSDQGPRNYRKLADAVRLSRIYRNRTVSRSEVVSLTALEKKDFDAMFKGHSPVQNLTEWLDGFRLEEAVPLLREMKAERKGASQKARTGQDAAPVSEKKERESRIEEIAGQCGFSGRKHLNRACRTHIGMSLHELIRIL